MKPARPLLFLLCILLTLAVPSCGKEGPPPAPSAVLAAMTAAAGTVPPGRVYDTGHGEGHPNRLTDTLLSALYGEGARGLTLPPTVPPAATDTNPHAVGAYPPVGACALFLSMTEHPCELAVFFCSDAATVNAVAALCTARLDLIRRARADGEYASLCEEGLVAVEGSYVLLCLCEDPEAALRGARRAMRGG